MNKADLIAHVADETGMSKREAGDTVDVVIDAIVSAVAKGDKVSLPGFGSFEKRKRAARTARNPQTGKPIKVPATSVPAFKAGQAFKQTVAKKKSAKKK